MIASNGADEVDEARAGVRFENVPLVKSSVVISSRDRSGAPFSRKVSILRLLSEFDSDGKVLRRRIQAALDSGRIVEYPLDDVEAYSFDVVAGQGSFTSRGQEFSVVQDDTSR